MEQTLEQLKAENAAREATQAPNPQDDAGEVNDEAANVDEPIEQTAESDEGESDTQAEAEDWAKGDDQESQGAGKKFTDQDVAAAKNKLRAKLDRQHQSEIEKLQLQLEEEKRRNQQVPQIGEKPKLEQFYDQDNPEEAFAEALVDWKLKASAAQQQVSHQQYEHQRKALELQRRVEESVEQHYGRAEKLAEASGIAPELYQSADFNVRQAIESVFPGGGGEAVTNALIASLGEGSEKVFYNLGVNQARRNELVNLLKEEPSGLRASVFLGKLAAELSAPQRKKSNAPAPATQVKGDRPTTEAGRALHKKYQDASKSGDIGLAVRLKREAKKAGVSTQSW